MKSSKSQFVCQSCGVQSPKWMGRCPACGQWDTMVEEVTEFRTTPLKQGTPNPVIPLDSIPAEQEKRIRCYIEELDRVLGGGLVPGSVVLVGGDPGIGKSTLMLQSMGALASQGLEVLYVSGEESVRQIRMRSERLGVSSSRILVLAETCLEHILSVIEERQPKALVIDSIQTMFTDELGSVPGSVGQVREVAARLVALSKKTDISSFLVGHVTKEGAIAGPRVLEHMVDTVVYFEGDRGHAFRILRAVKNRFGSTNEIGVFQMKDSGLVEIRNPSSVFLAERPINVPGSVVIPCMEGSRPILVELQALVSSTATGTPRRTTIGVDHQRTALLVAVLEKKVGLTLGCQDVFINVAGGVRIEEPAVDLGLAVAMASSFLDKPVPSRMVVVGEVGLAGEIRGIGQIETRLTEARKLGFSRCILPNSNLSHLRQREDLDFIGVKSVAQALEAALA
jgi:DNA repair protein RadA/Sms